MRAREFFFFFFFFFFSVFFSRFRVSWSSAFGCFFFGPWLRSFAAGLVPVFFVCSPFSLLRCRSLCVWSCCFCPAVFDTRTSFTAETADGDEAGDGWSEMSGVAVGEGLEGNGDSPAGGFSFNDDGTRINESKEPLAGVGDGIGVGEVRLLLREGLGWGSVAVASM